MNHRRNCNTQLEFMCRSAPHECIMKQRVCDTIPDCDDRSDEENCKADDYEATYLNDAENDHFSNLRHKKDGSTPTVVSAIPIGFTVQHDHRHPVLIGLFVDLHTWHIYYWMILLPQLSKCLARAISIYQPYTICVLLLLLFCWLCKVPDTIHLPASCVCYHFHALL